jgi:phage tail sheath protein FI
MSASAAVPTAVPTAPTAVPTAVPTTASAVPTTASAAAPVPLPSVEDIVASFAGKTLLTAQHTLPSHLTAALRERDPKTWPNALLAMNICSALSSISLETPWPQGWDLPFSRRCSSHPFPPQSRAM